MNQIKASLSLIPNTTRDTTHRIAEGVRASCKGDPLVEKFIKKFAAASEKNCNLTSCINDSNFYGGQAPIIEGQTLFPFCSLINHCCDNNITNLEGENELVFYVVKPIKAGEQLFFNYLGYKAPMMPTFARQERLCTTFDFVCDCDFCNEDYTPDITRTITAKANEKAKFTRYIMSDDQAIEQVKENWKIVNNDPSNDDALLYILHSHFLLQQMLTSDVEPTHRANEN
jgi:hypothetical protein